MGKLILIERKGREKGFRASWGKEEWGFCFVFNVFSKSEFRPDVCNVYRITASEWSMVLCHQCGEALATTAKHLLPSRSVKSALFQESLRNPSFSCALFPPQPLQEEKVIRGIFNSPDPQFYGLTTNLFFILYTMGYSLAESFYTRISLGFLMNELKFMNNSVFWGKHILSIFCWHIVSFLCRVPSHEIWNTLADTDRCHKKEEDGVTWIWWLQEEEL